jgi:A/G-specific adenine glycosylase
MSTQTPPVVEIDTPWKRLLRRRLLAWYRRHERDLPWRRTRDPYAIWVSEIMLQQTQVATVIPYFERFMQALPNLPALAQANERDVLNLWEGLGYYRRARQLHRAAKIIVERHGGEFPRDLDRVRQLPGIGRYTAGAIVSIAFDLPAPILEANTVRLLSRLVAFEGDPASTAGRRLLWHLAESVLPARDCRSFNQALMELGSLVCVPQTPACDRCPLQKLCRTSKLGRQEQIPALRPKPQIEAVLEAAIVVWRSGRVLLRQRPSGERWAGLWDFLRFGLSDRRGRALEQELREKTHDHCGLSVDELRHLATLKHGVTRFRITLECYAARTNSRQTGLPEGTWRWVRPSDLKDFPLSVTGRKLSRLLVSDKGA